MWSKLSIYSRLDHMRERRELCPVTNRSTAAVSPRLDWSFFDLTEAQRHGDGNRRSPATVYPQLPSLRSVALCLRFGPRVQWKAAGGSIGGSRHFGASWAVWEDPFASAWASITVWARFGLC
jgi:hypothetical protein